MINMLRMDLRRIFRSKMFYIAFLCLAAGILISIITLRTVTDPELRQQAIDAGMEITASDESDFDNILNMTQTQALLTTVYNGGFFFVALYVVVVLMVCTDFSSGYAKNIFSVYGGRWRYFASKLLCMMVVCAVWIAGTIAVFRLTCAMVHLQFQPEAMPNLLLFIGGYLLIGTAFAAQGIFVSTLLRSEGAGIAAAILVPSGVAALLVNMISGIFGISILEQTLYGSIQKMTDCLTVGGPAMGVVIVSMIWVAVWGGLSMLALYKKDI